MSRHRHSAALRFIALVTVTGKTAFNLLAVWTQIAKDGMRQKDQQARSAGRLTAIASSWTETPQLLPVT